EDVQRMSHTVAILNHGQLVAQAPIDELLKHIGSTVYSIVMTGDSAGVQMQLGAQPWIGAVDVVHRNGTTRLQVTVRDEHAAEKRLLPLLAAQSGVTIKEYGQKKADLEEVFVRIVEGEG